jgi:hypothetical protein
MPGLAGLISTKSDNFTKDIESVLETLRYGWAQLLESYQDINVSLGCVHFLLTKLLYNHHGGLGINNSSNNITF